MGLAEIFSATSRQIKQGVREKIFADARLETVRHTFLFAFLGGFLWGADLATDPSQTVKALVFRVAVMAVLLASAFIKWWSNSLSVHYVAAYLSLIVCEAGLIKFMDGMAGGTALGVGQFLYFFLGASLFCSVFPSNLNFLGCALLALAPHAVGELLAASFPHLLYASVIWPASGMTMFILWKNRMLMVEKQKLLREIESSVVTDPLTGLLNFRGLGKAFQRLAKLAKTKQIQQNLLLVELDGFQGIVDAHGEGYSASLLGKLGELIDISFRGRDITAYLNESQFACILPNTTSEQGFSVAERLRKTIEETSFECPTAETGKLRCTVSIAIVPFNIEEIKSLLNRARIGIDQARAKGGNQCVFI